MALQSKHVAIPFDDQADTVSSDSDANLDLAAAVTALQRRGALVPDPSDPFIVSLPRRQGTLRPARIQTPQRQEWYVAIPVPNERRW